MNERETITMSEKSDQELIEEAKNGSLSSFDELIVRHSSKLFQVSFGLLGNKEDAEEVVQDAFVRAFKALPKFRGDASFDTWTHRIVVNLSRNKYQWNRRRGAELNVSMTRDPSRTEREVDGEEMLIPDKSMGPERIVESVELEERIMKNIDEMPDKIKETMILRHVDDLPYEKIAEVLGCKVGTVKSRLARGREMLKNQFASH